MPTAVTSLKRALIGDPRPTAELQDQLLPRWLALPVFSSDTLSSVAYATEEMMIVLALAGAAAFDLVGPLSLAIAAVMVIVLASYSQTVRAYPGGGGAYRVARDNLGQRAGLVAAAALLIDYALTAAVSVAAGTAAMVSAVPELQQARVPVALAFLAVMTVANLRGVREAGLVFAVPVYAFVAVMLAMIVTGFVRCVGGCPAVPFEGTAVIEPVAGLGAFLVLRAFATGATALTGVEAVSNGVPAFRPPASRNAAAVLSVIGVIGVTLFVGISLLAVAIPGVVAFAGLERTVTSQIAAAVFGGGSAGFYAVQIATTAILVLAANTAYADFPRLASVLAADRFAPRQLASRGDRLAFSNGILVLSLVASVLLVVSGARVTGLVALYVVGVFTAFTLSQTGMVRRWLTLRDRGWRRGAALNAVGATATGTVLGIVAVTKFRVGAWVIVLAMPLLVAGMAAVRRHYERFAEAVAAEPLTLPDTRPVHVVILEDRVDAATAASLSYAKGIGAASITAVAVPPPTRRDVRSRWRQMAPDIPMQEMRAFRRSPSMAMHDAARQAAAAHEDAFTTAVVPETLSRSWVDVLRRHRVAQRVKARLVADGSLVVTNVVAPPGGPGPYQVVEPAEHHVVVLVNRVHAAALRSLAYARSLDATSVRALSVNVTGERSAEIMAAWQRVGLDVPLELVDSPFRSLVDTVLAYVRELRPDGQHTVVTVVMSELVLPDWWQRPLHNQTVLQIKSALLFARGVVTTSVPSRLQLPRRR